MLKRIGYGVLQWAIPSLPLMHRDLRGDGAAEGECVPCV